MQNIYLMQFIFRVLNYYIRNVHNIYDFVIEMANIPYSCCVLMAHCYLIIIVAWLMHQVYIPNVVKIEEILSIFFLLVILIFAGGSIELGTTITKHIVRISPNNSLTVCLYFNVCIFF